MRKLDKTEILAVAYNLWQDSLAEHPVYSSNHKFYRDIAANLLWIQKGVCAYTERFLYDYEELAPKLWKDGRYLSENFYFYGHLDHYDTSLKKDKGWLWSNFFVIDSDINTKWKRGRQVRNALKPDALDYDPFYLLEYNFNEHKFVPNKERDFNLQRDIAHDIDVLGLNFKALVQKRREKLNELVEHIYYNNKTAHEAKTQLREYFTAFEMIIQTLNL